MTHCDKGTCAEGKDTSTLDLPGGQLAMLSAVAATGTPVVAVLINGRPATFGAGPFAFTGPNNALLSRLAAVVVGWRPGEAGGAAIWDLLTGKENFSGRLTQNWLRSVGAVRGPTSPWFQYRAPGLPFHYLTEPATPLFSFGFGLSYTQFTFTGLKVIPKPTVAGNTSSSHRGHHHIDRNAVGTGLISDPPTGSVSSSSAPFVKAPVLMAGATFVAAVNITSHGAAGLAVVQIYASHDPPTRVVRYKHTLLCFAKVRVPAGGGVVQANVNCKVDDLDVYDTYAKQYVVHSGSYTLTAAQHSGELTSRSSDNHDTASAKLEVQGTPGW